MFGHNLNLSTVLVDLPALETSVPRDIKNMDATRNAGEGFIQAELVKKSLEMFYDID